MDEKKAETKPKKAEKKDETKLMLEEKDKKIAELTDTLQRLQAEMENLKKRITKENEDFRKYISAETISRLLPILDSFELALKNTSNKEEFVKGVELIFGQFFDILQKEGLRQIDTRGQKFDPYRHEVLLTEKTEKDEQDSLIVEELQRGYMFKDRVLRYSKVKIFKR